MGFFSNIFGYLAYLAATLFGASPKIAMTLVYGFGVVIGFIGNRNLTFGHRGSVMGAGFRYLITHCLGYFINLGILVVFVDKFGYKHQWVQAVAIFIVAAFLFLAFKIFVFPNDNETMGDRR